MKKKTLFYILSGYFLGNIISGLYNEKKWTDLKKAVEKAEETGKDGKKVLFANFIHTQKRFFEEMKEAFLTEERKAEFEDKKEEVKKLLQKYKEEGEDLLKDLKVKGKNYATDMTKKVEEFYQEKKQEWEEKLKEFGEMSVDDFKEKFAQVKEKLHEFAEKMKK